MVTGLWSVHRVKFLTHRYVRQHSADHTHARASFSIMEYFLSHSVRDLDANATVLSESPNICVSTAPSVVAGICSDKSWERRVEQ